MPCSQKQVLEMLQGTSAGLCRGEYEWSEPERMVYVEGTAHCTAPAKALRLDNA